MPIDYSFEHVPNFRDLSHAGLHLLQRLQTVRASHPGQRPLVPAKVRAVVKATPVSRRNPMPGSLYH
jgi:hypothetical protein